MPRLEMAKPTRDGEAREEGLRCQYRAFPTRRLITRIEGAAGISNDSELKAAVEVVRSQ